MRTDGIETLLGDPKRAVRRMTLPLVVALLAQTVYNLIDAVWVAGLGPDALAAVGLVFPVFFILIGLANGLGIGASAVVARRIGADDREGADSAARHSIWIAVVVSLILTVPLLTYADVIFSFVGGGEVEAMTLEYGRVIFLGTIIIFMATLTNSLLRAEGAVKRAMAIMIFASILNIILDPIFIYTLGLGVAGAAWASLLAFTIATLVTLYWYLPGKGSYLNIGMRGFRYCSATTWDILRIGIPSAAEMIVLSISAFILNMVVIQFGGVDGVAIFSSGWRLLQLAMIPYLGIAGALVPICAAAYGAKRYDKLSEAFSYSNRLTFISMALLAAALGIFAYESVILFTYAEETAHLADGMVLFLRISVLFLPFIGVGGVAAAMFQGIGMANRALIGTILRNLILTLIPAYMLGARVGLVGIWWGQTLGEIAGSVLVLAWGWLTLRAMMAEADKVRARTDTLD